MFVETDGLKILVDPGKLKYKDEYTEYWKNADIILITHKHIDHINEEVIINLNIPIYSTKEIQNAYSNLNINIVKEDDLLEFNNTKIELVKAVHGYNPNLKDGKEIFEKVGFIIDDGKTRLYVTSDTICFNNNYKADVVALPVTGYGLTMSGYEASLFANELGAKLVLPIHMDNDMYPTDMNYMVENFNKFNINYKVLEIEEIIEV